ncbi:MAG: L-aspartate oxidase [Pseudomonadota bacterium]
MAKRHHFDIIIVGSGAAGLTHALALPSNLKIAVLSKGKLSAGSTNWAQGGIAAVLREDDSVESHIEDTLIAGAGLCRRETVEFIAERGRVAIDKLAGRGVAFNRDHAAPKTPGEDGGYHLTKEGGHSHRRIVHVDDATGRAVQKSLSARAREAENIELFERHVAVDLITARHLSQSSRRCHGVYVYDRKRRRVEVFQAGVTVLASGGASKVYLYTSNPDGATGDGIAMAWRAGCRVANLEFNQFHPTCLYHPRAKSFLVTEAMRGEGAVLRLPGGERFMDRFDTRAELAPRDIVARAIDHEMKRVGSEYVELDISHKSPDFIDMHFPTIRAKVAEYGFDITKQPLPVVPAAHYTCGGVMTDLRGRTDLAGLYAIGECAHTGLHGANRMASNSLLECLVMADAAAADIEATIAEIPPAEKAPLWDESRVTHSDEEVVVTHNWHELRRAMWNYVGIVRTNKRLERARHRIDLLASEISEYYGHFRVSRDLLELRNLVTMADLIIRSAVLRKESRGLHYTTDYPDLLPVAADTILTPPESWVETAGMQTLKQAQA